MAVDVGQPHVAAAERNVSRVWSMPSRCSIVACRSWTSIGDPPPCSRTRPSRRRSSPPRTPPPASQIVKPNGLWSRPFVPWANGVRPNSAAHTTSVVVEQPAPLQVRQQRGDRLVDRPRVVLVPLPEVRVLVPPVAVDPRARQLDEAHAALDEPPREQALPSEDPRRLVRRRRGRTSARVAAVSPSIASARAPPPACGTPARSCAIADSTGSRAPVRATTCSSSVPSRSSFARCSAGSGSVGRMFATGVVRRPEDRALVRRRQEAAREAVEPAGRNQPAVEHDERGQVAVLAAEPVRHPRAHARPAREAEAGVQEVVRVRVLGELRRHRAHDAQVVGMPARRAGTGRSPAGRTRRSWRNFHGDCSVVPLLLNCVGSIFIPNGWPFSRQPRLRVERVDLRRAAVHVEEDDAAGPRRMMGQHRAADGVGQARTGPGRTRRRRVAHAACRAARSCRNRRRTAAASRDASSEPGCIVRSAPSSVGSSGWLGPSLALRALPRAQTLHQGEDELLGVQQDVGEVGPRILVVRPVPTAPPRRLLAQEPDREVDLGRFRGTGVRADASRRSAPPASGRAIVQLALRPAAAPARSTNGSLSSVRAWAGTFERWRRPIVVAGTGASNAVSIGGRKLRRTAR